MTLLEFLQSIQADLMLDARRFNTDFLDIAPRTYPAGSAINRQGDQSTKTVIVASGWSYISRHLSNGTRQIIDTPLKGDVLGLPSFDWGASNSLTSVSDITVYEVPSQTLRKALEQDANLGMHFSRIAARQHAIAVERLTSVCRRNALERTAHYLLELSERLGGIAVRRYDCPLTQHEIADTLGLTQIHVNRTLRELRERELVSFRAGSVEFLSRQKLVKLAGFDNGYLRYNWPSQPLRPNPAHKPAAGQAPSA